MPDGRCADFVGALYSLPAVDTSRIELCNIWLAPPALDDEDETQLYKKRVEWLAKLDPPLILVNLDPPFEVTQGGVELWRCPVSIYLNIY